METLGYRIKAKFPALEVGVDILGGAFQKLRDQLSNWHGLVLYHGQPESLLFEELAARSQAKQIAVLIVSTNRVSLPLDLQPNPYLHLYSIGVENSANQSDPLTPSFQTLVERFKALTDFPSEDDMRAMWDAVDPVSDIFERLHFLENVLLSTSVAPGEIPEKFKDSLTRLFPGLNSYADLKEEYLRLCQTGDIKKKRTAGI